MLKYIIPFLLIGCHPSISLHSDVAVDSSFTQEELSDIVQASDEWKNTTDNLVDLNLIITDHPEEYGNDTMKIVLDKALTLKDGNLLFGHTAFVASVSQITLYPASIADSPMPPPFKEIIMHELGHSLGLAHMPEGLMTPMPTGINCIDSATLNQFCGIHDCSGIKIKTDCVD